FTCDPTVPPTLDRVLARTHPADRDLVRQVTDRASTDGEGFDFVHRLLMAYGEVKWIRVVGPPRTDDGGGDLVFVGAVTDITDAKHAAEALHESEERFRTMADTLQEAIWIRGLAPERILYASPSFERIWGLRPEVVDHEPHLWIEAIHPD